MFHVEHLVRSEKPPERDSRVRKARNRDAFEEPFPFAVPFLPAIGRPLDLASRPPRRRARRRILRDESTLAVPGEPSKRQWLPLGYPPPLDILGRVRQLLGPPPSRPALKGRSSGKRPSA